MSRDSDQPRRLQHYNCLINAFISEEISATEFEKAYLNAIKGEQSLLPDSVFSVLQELFEDVDAYVSDPDLRTEPADLDEEQLRLCAIRAQSALKLLGYS